jgi:hypothetical protein
LKVLVGTPCQLLLVDLEKASTQIIENHRRYYYGISWWENSEYPVLTHSTADTTKLTTLEDYVLSESGFVSFGEEHGSILLSRPHQVLCAPNGWAVIANTGRNRITIYDPASHFHRDLRINDINHDVMGHENKCGEHFNSVFIKNDRLYVLAHGFEKQSYVLEYTFPGCELVRRQDASQKTGMHNIWVDDDGRMISCNSPSGELVDIKSDEVIWRGAAVHSRGLAVSRDHIILGDSEIGKRENRVYSQTGLWLIDRRSMKTLDYIPLGPYGVVFDIRLLDVPDEAHHGKTFKNIDALEQRNCLQENRKRKLSKIRMVENDSFTPQMKFILGNVQLNEQGWVAPWPAYISQGQLIAIRKKRPASDFNLKIDYAFLESQTFPEQHFSLIAGYKGNHDKNMVAVFLHHTSKKATHLYLMKNENGVWGQAEVLIPEVSHAGQLEVSRTGNALRISCNGSKPIKKVLNAIELEGDVGIRCQGAHFRNFVVQEVN